jgi:uncharacterized protein YjaZ
LDPNLTTAILTEAPYNDYFGEDIPGNVGKYIGYRIVQSWMKQQKGKSKTDLNQLLKTPAKTKPSVRTPMKTFFFDGIVSQQQKTH